MDECVININQKKSRGPIIDSWGTPRLRGVSLDIMEERHLESWLATTTWVLPNKYDLILSRQTVPGENFKIA